MLECLQQKIQTPFRLEPRDVKNELAVFEPVPFAKPFQAVRVGQPSEAGALNWPLVDGIQGHKNPFLGPPRVKKCPGDRIIVEDQRIGELRHIMPAEFAPSSVDLRKTMTPQNGADAVRASPEQRRNEVDVIQIQFKTRTFVEFLAAFLQQEPFQMIRRLPTA